MEVNKLESKEVFIIGFGGAATLTLIILSSMYFGHMITTKSNVQAPITVTAAQPHIDVHVPNAPTPEVKVTTAAPQIDVHVPVGPAPTVNVSTPPATVTVLDKREEKKEAAPLHLPADAAKPIPVSVPAPTKTEKTSAVVAPTLEEEASLDTLYKNAEGYIVSYCAKNGLNVAAEAKKWNETWKNQVEQAINDGTDSSEQTFINRTVLAKRGNFAMDTATPEKIVEACRIFLRYRDGQLTMMTALQDALTKDNLKKTVSFLAQGSK